MSRKLRLESVIEISIRMLFGSPLAAPKPLKTNGNSYLEIDNLASTSYEIRKERVSCSKSLSSSLLQRSRSRGRYLAKFGLYGAMIRSENYIGNQRMIGCASAETEENHYGIVQARECKNTWRPQNTFMSLSRELMKIHHMSIWSWAAKRLRMSLGMRATGICPYKLVWTLA